GVVGDCANSQFTLPLLQGREEVDDGSRDSIEQGWPAYERECSSGMQSLQFEEREPDSILVGCPGCEECIDHHGYIFHFCAGRPTRAHEQIFLLSKSEKYFYNAA